MSWAKAYMDKLRAGETVEFRPRGNSMEPRIRSGQLCKVEPFVDGAELEDGDIVLCRVKGNDYLHLVKASIREGANTRYQIGNNRGGINGWVTRAAIYGVLVEVS